MHYPSVSCQAPSNIAFIKYWGKTGNQLPCNASLSLTLRESWTRMTISVKNREKQLVSSFQLSGKQEEKFQKKIERYLQSVFSFPWMAEVSLDILSDNSFPHSAGIASSASSMCALAGAILELNKKLTSETFSVNEWSSYARLGSGSAARSVLGGFSIWGKHPSVLGSSDDYAISVDNVHERFLDIRDSILIISSEEKAVSSSLGHALMEDHPFRDARFKNAQFRLIELISSLRQGNWERFGEIIEKEALELHGLMMNSSLSFILMRPNTLEAIERIRRFRKDHQVPVYFTLDAGPNVHLIYPGFAAPIVEGFIQSNLKTICQNERVIDDRIGFGPTLGNEIEFI